MKMACTFCPHGAAAPAFYKKANRPPATVGRAIEDRDTAGNPRFLILPNQTSAQHLLGPRLNVAPF